MTFPLRFSICLILACTAIWGVLYLTNGCESMVANRTANLKKLLENHDYALMSPASGSLKEQADKQSQAFDAGAEKIGEGEIQEGLTEIIESETSYYFNSNRIWPVDLFASTSFVENLAKYSTRILAIWLAVASTLIAVFNKKLTGETATASFVMLTAAVSVLVGGALGLLYGSQWGFLGQLLATIAAILVLLVANTLFVYIQIQITSTEAASAESL